ncbi:hypothetical protein [Paraburkholderia ferrariae]|nr:hypothetical protein [Paraburkholderia ferrariae]
MKNKKNNAIAIAAASPEQQCIEHRSNSVVLTGHDAAARPETTGLL